MIGKSRIKGKAVFGRNGRKGIVSYSVKGPGDAVLDAYCDVTGAYLLEDGSVGYLSESEMDPSEYGYDPDEFYDDVESGRADGLIVGEMYMDTVRRDGRSTEGGCYGYVQGETLRSWLERNDYPLVDRRIPDEVWEALEGGVPAPDVFGAVDRWLDGRLDEEGLCEELLG